jgi:signal transduction histidine kinase
MKKIFIHWIVLLLLSLQLQAQINQQQADSLEKALPNARTNSELQAEIYEKLIDFYYQKDIKRALNFAHQRLHIFNSFDIPDKSKVSKALGRLGILHAISSQFDSSEYYFLSSLKTCEEAKDTLLLVKLRNNYANMLWLKLDYTKALQLLHENLELFEKVKSEDEHTTYGTLAIIYGSIKDYKSAVHYDSLAYKMIALTKDELRANLILGNLANHLSQLGEYAAAEKVLLKTADYLLKNQRYFNLGNTYRALADIYGFMNQPKKQIFYAEKAVELLRKSNSWRQWGLNQYYLASLKFDEGKMVESRKLIDEVLQKPEAIESQWATKEDAWYLMMKINLYEHKLQEAKKAETDFLAARDSLAFEKKKKDVAELNTKYETEKKQRENELLKKDQLIKEATIKRQRAITISIAIAVILFIGLVIALYVANKRMRQVNKVLNEKNSEIQQQKEDIEQKRAALEKALRELQETQDYLIQSEKMASLGQLTAGIAHEINNPVNFILGGVNGLKTYIRDFVTTFKNNAPVDIDESLEDVYSLTRSIEAGASRTAAIVESLKKFAHGGLDGVYDVVDLNEYIESMLIIMITGDHHVQVVRQLGNIPRVECDITEVSQAFMNVIKNALQAMEDAPGTLTVITKQVDDHYVGIYIKDTGCGILEEFLPRVFDPFFTTRDVGKGTGLGLSVAYRIISKHKGTINIESEWRKGTTVSIMLPLSGGSASSKK